MKPCALCPDDKLDLHILGVEVRKYGWELSLCCVAIMICKGCHLRGKAAWSMAHAKESHCAHAKELHCAAF